MGFSAISCIRLGACDDDGGGDSSGGDDGDDDNDGGGGDDDEDEDDNDDDDSGDIGDDGSCASAVTLSSLCAVSSWTLLLFKLNDSDSLLLISS